MCSTSSGVDPDSTWREEDASTGVASPAPPASSPSLSSLDWDWGQVEARWPLRNQLGLNLPITLWVFSDAG